MSTHTSTRRERLRQLTARVRSNPAQFVVSVIIAALLAAATWLSTQAAGAWTESTRLETRATAATVEDLRHVYQDEAPMALGTALMLIRADAISAASTDPTDALAMEAAALRKAAGEWRAGLRRNDSLMMQRYEQPDHGYAVNTRLADVLRRSEDGTRQQIAESVEDGDRLARSAMALCVLAVVAGVAFLVVRLFGRRHARGGEPDVGLVPQPWDETSQTQRVAAAVSLVAWLLLPVLTAMQLALSNSASRADAESSRRATALTGSIHASQLFQSFVTAAKLSELQVDNLGIARQFVAVGPEDPEQWRMGRADEAAARRWAAVASGMTAPPAAAHGVDEAVVAMVSSSPSDHVEQLGLQHEAVDRAQQHGDAANLATLALLLAGLTATVAAMARLQGSSRVATAGAATMVAAAAGVAVVAVVSALG